MIRNLKIIHIEDVKSDAELVDWILKKSKIAFEMIVVDTREQYQKALIEFHPDIVLSDHSLPTFNSLEALNILKGSGLDIPFILITSTVSEEFAVNVMKEGASDYVLKDRLQRLPNAIINAIEKFQSDFDKQISHHKLGCLMIGHLFLPVIPLLQAYGDFPHHPQLPAGVRKQL